MAEPISFKPKMIDPREELQHRLERAPLEHAESILVALDVLEAAHRKGLLGLAEGAISSKDAVFAKFAEYAKQPESTNAMRNLLSLGKLAGSLNPDALEKITKSQPRDTVKPLSLFTLFFRLGNKNVRRGLGIVLDLLALLGAH